MGFLGKGQVSLIVTYLPIVFSRSFDHGGHSLSLRRRMESGPKDSLLNTTGQCPELCPHAVISLLKGKEPKGS